MVSPHTAPRRPTNWFPWLAGLTLFAVGGLGVLTIGAATVGASGVGLPGVGLIELSGVITDQGTSGLLGGGSGGARVFIEDLDKARLDPTIKAVVIRINSPGGSPAASQEMYQAVRRLHDAKKPVICSMGDVAASGGYYVAAACDKIYANSSTLTGSIGVIAELPNYAELARKVGVGFTTIKSGKFKDTGNPTRALTPADRQLLQAMNTDVYLQFVADVLAGRKEPTKGKLTRPKLLAIADGRAVTGNQALRVGLVDANGGLYEAIHEAGTRANLEGEPKVRQLSGRGGGLGSLLGSSSQSGGFDSLAQSLGAAVARGALGEFKAEAQSAPMPMAR